MVWSPAGGVTFTVRELTAPTQKSFPENVTLAGTRSTIFIVPDSVHVPLAFVFETVTE